MIDIEEITLFYIRLILLVIPNYAAFLNINPSIIFMPAILRS